MIGLELRLHCLNEALCTFLLQQQLLVRREFLECGTRNPLIGVQLDMVGLELCKRDLLCLCRLHLLLRYLGVELIYA